MAVNATVNTPRTTQASLSDANTSQVVRITVPGPKGDTGDSGNLTLNTLQDVNVSTLNDGAVLEYDTTTSKWGAKNTIGSDGITPTLLTINCGNY